MRLQVSGREVFEFRPELVDDDDAEATDTRYDSSDDEEADEQQVFKKGTKSDSLPLLAL